jgi:hypothetical protein
MADLFNQQISATYSGLLKTSSSGVLSASLSQISDGRGNTSPLYLSTGSIQFYGAYSFPNADGSANQVLKTDGAGVLTWENDSLSNTLNFSGGTGTGSVTLDTQVLAFTGTANQIETSASSQAITLSFPTAGVTLPDGSVATTQSANDNSTKVATTAYVDNQVDNQPAVTKTGTITADQIAIWNDSTNQLRSDPTVVISSDVSITLYQPNQTLDNGDVNRNNYNIGGGNFSGRAGANNNDPSYMTGFGYNNLASLTTGNFNTAFGYEALSLEQEGDANSAFGYAALKNANTQNNGGGNTAFGYLSLTNCTTGIANVAVGKGAISSITTTNNNIAVGDGAGLLSTGAGSLFLGHNAGSWNTSGSYNVFIGGYDGDTTVTGNPDFTTVSNHIVLSDGEQKIGLYFNASRTLYLPSYGLGTHTGTQAKSLGVDSTGKVIETDISGVQSTGTIVANQVAVWDNSSDTLRSDSTVTILGDHKISLSQPNSSAAATGSFNIGGGNISSVFGNNNTGFGFK